MPKKTKSKDCQLKKDVANKLDKIKNNKTFTK